MNINFQEITTAKAKLDHVIVFAVAEDRKLSPLASAINKQAGGALFKAITSPKFTGKKGQFVSVVAPDSLKCDRILLAGIGAVKGITRKSLESLGGAVAAQVNAIGAKSATFMLDELKGCPVLLPEAAARIAHGANLRSYNFDKYFTTKPADEKPTITGFTVALADSKSSAKFYGELDKVAEGVFLTRNLVSEPANIIYPETFAEECLKLEALGVEVEVLDEPDMYKLGFGALLGVGQGSSKESKMVIMKWNGLGKTSKVQPIAFVGKGVTFDTGGISIKPSSGMEEMKYDMGGAGTVLGLMKALAGRKAKVNVIGVAGLVENMPGGNAQRPGDVVTSYSGQTIEVINTDAEGRLVLADALWYTQKHLKPKFIIDLATLTGAILIALGSSRAGLFSNDDKLAEQLFKTGEKVGEELWRLPLGDVYDKQINSDIADMLNSTNSREAGSITAAQFLQRFVNKTPWAHLDIAGMAWQKKDSDICPKGATAYGVRLLNELVKDYYEAK